MLRNFTQGFGHGWAGHVVRGEARFMQGFCLGNLKERGYVKDLNVDGEII
jgi:hypothetical protein